MFADVAVSGLKMGSASCWAPLAPLSKCGGELHRWSILLSGHEGGFVVVVGVKEGCVHHRGKPGAVWQECLIM